MMIMINNSLENKWQIAYKLFRWYIAVYQFIRTENRQFYLFTTNTSDTNYF